jgi:hypothetical protein
MDVFFVFAYLAWNKSFDFPAQKRISSSWLEWSLSTHKHTSTHKNTYRLSFVILLGTNIVFEDSTLIYIFYFYFFHCFIFLNSPKYSLCSFTKNINEKINIFIINIINVEVESTWEPFFLKAFLYLSYQVLWYTSKHWCWVGVSFFSRKEPVGIKARYMGPGNVGLKISNPIGCKVVTHTHGSKQIDQLVKEPTLNRRFLTPYGFKTSQKWCLNVWTPLSLVPNFQILIPILIHFIYDGLMQEMSNESFIGLVNSSFRELKQFIQVDGI